MRVTCDGRKVSPRDVCRPFVNAVHANPIRWHDHGDLTTPATPLDRRNAVARYLGTSQRLTRQYRRISSSLPFRISPYSYRWSIPTAILVRATSLGIKDSSRSLEIETNRSGFHENLVDLRARYVLAFYLVFQCQRCKRRIIKQILEIE